MDLWIIFWRGNYPLYFIFLKWLLVSWQEDWSLIHRSDDNSKSLIHVLYTDNGGCILQFHMQWRKLLQLFWHFGTVSDETFKRDVKYALSMRSGFGQMFIMYVQLCIRKYWMIHKIEKAIDGQRAVVNLLFC